MPKKQLLGSIIIIIILGFICMYIYDNFRVEKHTKIIVETNNNNVISEYLSTKKVNYYLYNLDNIVIDFTDRKLDLNKALELKQISMKEIISNLEEKANFNDGNTVLYQNDNLSVLECTLDNGKVNYIFSGKSMTYKDSFCLSKPYLCSFIKTYYVLDINDSKDDSVYLTLRNEKSEVATIEIDKDKVENLQIGNSYKITFASVNDRIDSDIKGIFENNDILNIELLHQEELPIDNDICK